MKVVYMVKKDWWNDFCGNIESDSCVDSIWSRKEDAKRRVDDLANECIRQEWYSQLECPEYFELNEVWNSDRTMVTFSVDNYGETIYWIDEMEVDPVLDDFEGP